METFKKPALSKFNESTSVDVDPEFLQDFPFLAKFDGCIINAICNKILSTVYLEKKLGKCKGMNRYEVTDYSSRRIAEIFMQYKDRDIEQIGLGFPSVYTV